MIRKAILAILSALACLSLGACAQQCCFMKAISFWELPEEFSLPIWCSGGIGWLGLQFSHMETADASLVGEQSRSFFAQSEVWADFSVYDRSGHLHKLKNVRYTVVGIPLPLLVLAFGIYPFFAFLRGPYRRHRRRRKGLCPKCGYNLSGNVSGVCPECGDMTGEIAAVRAPFIRRLRLVAALASFAILASVCVACLSSYEVRDWVKFRLFYRDYLAWKEQGGLIREGLYEPLKLDRYRDGMVKGLSYDQILSKFPFLVDGDQYPLDSYKGEYLKWLRSENPEAEVLWFSREDGFDYCVRIDDKEVEICLIKG